MSSAVVAMALPTREQPVETQCRHDAAMTTDGDARCRGPVVGDTVLWCHFPPLQHSLDR